MEENLGPEKIEDLLAIPALADALESDRFRQFLDHVPVAIAVSELRPSENITYCNLEFERLKDGATGAVPDWTTNAFHRLTSDPGIGATLLSIDHRADATRLLHHRAVLLRVRS